MKTSFKNTKIGDRVHRVNIRLSGPDKKKLYEIRRHRLKTGDLIDDYTKIMVDLIRREHEAMQEEIEKAKG